MLIINNDDTGFFRMDQEPTYAGAAVVVPVCGVSQVRRASYSAKGMLHRVYHLKTLHFAEHSPPVPGDMLVHAPKQQAAFLSLWRRCLHTYWGIIIALQAYASHWHASYDDVCQQHEP